MDRWIIVDRIENGIAACEVDGRSMQMLPLSLLPPEVAEGDCLVLENGRYRIDAIETMRRREYNLRLTQRLMEASREE